MVDMGDDFFTLGKPHPMIDATGRAERIIEEAADREVAVLLLDFILGYVSSPDPVGDLVGAIRAARETARRDAAHLTMVASICSTNLDPQNLDQQKSKLEQAGVIVFPSNVQAAQFCAKLILARKGEEYGR
jgi:FdrA protein